MLQHIELWKIRQPATKLLKKNVLQTPEANFVFDDSLFYTLKITLPLSKYEFEK